MPVAFNIKGSAGIAMYGSRLKIVLFEFVGRIHIIYEDNLIPLAYTNNTLLLTRSSSY